MNDSNGSIIGYELSKFAEWMFVIVVLLLILVIICCFQFGGCHALRNNKKLNEAPVTGHQDHYIHKICFMHGKLKKNVFS